MGATVLYLVARYLEPPVVLRQTTPVLALQAAIRIGGDTDTTGSLVGAIVGAYYGEAVLKSVAEGRLWAGLENGKWGRDWGVGMGAHLARLAQ